MRVAAINIIKRLKRILVLDFVNKLERKARFVQRKSKLTAEAVNDKKYLPDLQRDAQPKDLCLKDLGYIDSKGAYYAAKLREDVSVYIGKTRNIKTRLIITKLSEENKKKREKKRIAIFKRGRGRITKRGISRNSIGACITNIPEEVLKKEQVYELI